MVIAEKHIRHFNLLNGNHVSRKSLVRFRDALKKDIDGKRLDAHVHGGVECIDILARLEAAIKKVNGRVMVASFKPVKVKKVKVINTVNGPEVVRKKKAASHKPQAAGRAVKKLVIEKVKEETVKIEKVKPASPKPETRNALGGLDASALTGITFKTFALDEPYKREFHKLNSDTQVMIWGVPGSGKTVYLLKFAQYLAEKQNLKVAFIAHEEFGRSTLSEKITEFKIGHANLRFFKNFTDDLNETFDVFFFDSINSIGMSLKDFRNQLDKYPGKMRVLIVQTTKDGDFRGGKDWEHEVDVAGEIRNRKLVLQKNRLDKRAGEKLEAANQATAIAEAKKKLEIKQAVKDAMPEPVIEPKAA